MVGRECGVGTDGRMLVRQFANAVSEQFRHAAKLFQQTSITISLRNFTDYFQFGNSKF